MTILRSAAAAWCCLAAVPTGAQTYDPETRRTAPALAGDAPLTPMVLPFTGATIGVEAGWIEHRYTARFTTFDATGEAPGSVTEDRAGGALGGGLFAGYDVAIAPALRLGGEAELVVGGVTNAFASGTQTYARHPHYGLRGVLRLGYVLAPSLMGYGTIGYGNNVYGVDDTIGIANLAHAPGGLAIGGGAEYRIDRHLGVRLDFKHVAASSNQLFLGVPVRF